MPIGGEGTKKIQEIRVWEKGILEKSTSTLRCEENKEKESEKRNFRTIEDGYGNERGSREGEKTSSGFVAKRCAPRRSQEN